MGSISTIGPFERLFAEGFAYRRAVQSPRNFVILLGIWLLFLPPLFSFSFMVLPLFSQGESNWSYIGWILYAAFILLFGTILFRVTKNYFADKAPNQS